MSDTRERLIDAATQLLDEGGPSAVTLREVGHRADVSHNAPYKHFADKEDLLAAVAARELRRRHEDDAAKSGDPTSLESMLLAYVRWAKRYPARFKLTFGTWTTGSPELTDAATAARRALVDAVLVAQGEGLLPDGSAERLAALVQAVAHGAADLELGGHLSRTGKGRADAADLVRDVLRALAAQAGSKHRASQ